MIIFVSLLDQLVSGQILVLIQHSCSIPNPENIVNLNFRIHVYEFI